MVVSPLSPARGLGTNSACCHKSRAKSRVRPSGSRNLRVCPVVSGSPHQPKGRYGHHCGTAAFGADSAGHVYCDGSVLPVKLQRGVVWPKYIYFISDIWCEIFMFEKH